MNHERNRTSMFGSDGGRGGDGCGGSIGGAIGGRIGWGSQLAMMALIVATENKTTPQAAEASTKINSRLKYIAPAAL